MHRTTGPTGHRTAPPRRTDSRRPGPDATARHRARARIPRYWFADQLLLALSGQRPVHSLLGHTLPTAYEHLAALAPGAPLRPAPPGGRTPVVQRCGEFQPRPGVIEAYARILAGDRLHALAFRLERCPDQRWRCAAVELGGVHA
ncbi:Rv3235 family protein [Streptomyces sp. NPDC052396]|uniref:Rv3235 family protein n=1 Tax=Streptomyces sp. NPDC052396 TaxID=3365689 RepID=UPI0037D2F892